MRDAGRILAILVAAVVIIFGWKYYEDTYQAKTAYAVVPAEVPVKKQATDDDGKAITGEHAYDYKFKFVLKNGEKRTLDYELSGEKVKPFTPNAVIKAEISKKRVIKGPNEISKDKVPNKVRKILNID
ncbi:YxeA family protein [Pediococcus acidilactici]|jgi:uncharacterized protein YxeA|uniref:YxeA family protein n=1 Tax=Pediococcus acidilactici TaxID=1254 RepID=UPI0003271CFF|nr:YxeA family protein [Pediococcus acidilactici]EOA09510.1 hypothetical protein PAD3_0603 [Pediococcus acidilactici D3]AOW73957.1 hypothetical protein A4V11_02525 [Pediococcus acidilactici]APR28632.1 hypothetical protein BTW26_06245 [Pediococcus acidilactici]KAF0334119.1 DUF1093 domain-containing protein [Pediococcus acidilactici]KAF0341484.1 DUF1093 domain-containing protein [Pediococcus acidilactici]